MSKNDMKDRICALSKNDLKDLVKTYRIPLDLHPRLPDLGFTMDRLPADAIGFYYEFLRFSGVRVPFSTFLLSSNAKIAEESHHLFLPLLERAPTHILLPTPDEIVASLPYSRLFKKSKGPSHANRPSKKRKVQKRDLEAVSSASELDQAEGTDETDLADLYAEIEDSLERDEGVSTRVVSAPTLRLGKRLGAPPSIVVASASEPSHIGTSALASTSGRSLSFGGVVVSGRVGKSRDEVMMRQMDPLDCLARGALARDAEYDKIPDDDFGTATSGEEIYLTLFPLALGPCHMPYPYEGVSSPLKALDRAITPTELRRTESLLPLELSNCVNVLSALLVSHGYKLNSRYANLVSSKAHLQEKFDKNKGDVKLLRSEVTSLDSKLENLQRGYDALGQENKELPLTVRDLQNELVLEKSKSQEYKDVAGGLREEVTQFVGSGVESLIWKLLSSDEFHVALARVASLGINYGVERGLRMGRTDVEFEAAVQKVSNFHVGAKADFDKALDDFPTTLFIFLRKIVAASEGSLADVAQILLDKFVRSATSVAAPPSSANEAPKRVPP
ncbi:hypothetical protein Tco_0505573 [Tanacetum coccineum]